MLQDVLDAHEPAPAYVVDRGWDLVLANAATARLNGLRPHVVNLGEAATVLLGRLRREVAEHGGAEDLAALLAEMELLAGPGTLQPAPATARDLVGNVVRWLVRAHVATYGGSGGRSGCAGSGPA